MSLASSREVFDWLWLAGLHEIGDAELGDCADGAAEGGADDNTAEVFGFLLPRDFRPGMLQDAITR